MSHTRRAQRGFTLIETIIILIVFSILGSVIVAYTAGLTKTPVSIARFKNSMSLQKVMENIISDYHIKKQACGSFNTACLTTALTTLRTNISNNSYGTYSIVFNGFTTFSSGSEDTTWDINDSTSGILRVVIKDSSSGATFTYLFTD